MRRVLRAERPARSALALSALIAGLAVFAALAVVVLGGHGRFDQAVNTAFAAHRTDALTTFFSGYTGFGRWFVLAAAAVAVIAALTAGGRRRAAAFIAVTLTAALLLDPLLKVLFGRERPPHDLAAIQVAGLAFPSGHAMSSATLALAVVVVAWPTSWRWPATALAFTFAALMGASRVYLGVHWTTDVLGAWAMAVVVVSTTALVFPPSPAATPAKTRETGAGAGRDTTRLTAVLLDWGGTLMEDDGTQGGPMATWHRVAAVDGAAEALGALGAAYHLIVATNAEDSAARDVRAALARVGLDDLVDDVVSSRDVGARKPDPFFYRAVLLRAGYQGMPLPPGNAVMVGDSWPNDVDGARRAGLRAIWFNPSRAPRPAGAAPPDGEVTRLADLPRAVAALDGRVAHGGRGAPGPAGAS